MRNLRVGFIGAGNMAEALCRGVLAAGLAPPERVVAFDPQEERRRLFADDLGVKVASGNDEVIAGADVIVLAVKPQALADVLPPVGALIGRDKLVITILAGVPTARIEAICAEGARVVRAMPNTPMLVGAGMSAVAPGPRSDEDDLRWTELDEVLDAVRSFLDPVLVGCDLRWSPESWRWCEVRDRA